MEMDKKAVEWTIGKLLALLLAVLLFVLIIYGFLTGAFSPMYEKIKGMADGVLIMLGIKSEPEISSPSKMFLILGENKKVILNEDGRCIVDFPEGRYTLNFNPELEANQKERLEFYGDVYKKELATPGSALKDEFWFIFLDQWQWTYYQPAMDPVKLPDGSSINYWWFNIKNSVFEDSIVEVLLGRKITPVEAPSRVFNGDSDFINAIEPLFDKYDNKADGEKILNSAEFIKTQKWVSIDSPVLNHVFHEREKQIKDDLKRACS